MPFQVLVVDDDPIVLDVLVRILGMDRALSVRTASRGLEAVDIAGSAKFDAIVCDISLPDLDGNLVVAEMRKRKICPPYVMMVSGVIRAAPQSLSGDMVFLPKPINPVVLLSALQARRAKVEKT